MPQRAWFTSDTHFGHAFCAEKIRGFKTVAEMDSSIVKIWNTYIAPGDRVYHLGDFSLHKKQPTLDILDQLNGEIYLIRGNHDSVSDYKIIADRFIWVKDYLYLKIQEEKITLCHYPFITWRSLSYGSWHLHGHCHGNLKPFAGKRIDVGWDVFQRPVSFEEIKAIMQNLAIGVYDHHA